MGNQSLSQQQQPSGPMGVGPLSFLGVTGGQNMNDGMGGQMNPLSYLMASNSGASAINRDSSMMMDRERDLRDREQRDRERDRSRDRERERENRRRKLSPSPKRKTGGRNLSKDKDNESRRDREHARYI